MKFIGITGGIGAGKSEILSYIKKHYNCEIYLADQVAHEVKKKGTDCYDQLVKRMGTDVVGVDGEIDKQKMAEKIFADGSLLEDINNLIHPAVKKFLLDRLEEARKRENLELFFVEAALLIECGYKELVDEMWYIYADPEVRRKRLKETRGYKDEKISQIMGNQLTDEIFRKNCDFVIDNSKTLADTYRQIDRKLEAFTWQD